MLQTLALDYSYTTTTTTSSASPLKLAMIVIPILILVVFLITAQWKIFKKAGKPGWASIVPVYNTWVLFEITGYPAWLSLLTLIPFIGIISAVVAILASFKLAKLFGKSDLFAVMNVLFPIVTMPMLAFGKAEFQGTPAATASMTNPSSFDPTNQTPPANTDTTTQAAEPSYTPPASDVPPAPTAPQAPSEPVGTPPAEPPTPPVAPTPGV